MSKLRYGIIGSGMMGREHIQNIKLLDNTELAAICEPNAKQVKLSLDFAPNCRVYKQLDDILQDKAIDAFVIASPNYLHMETLRQIMSTDTRPILVEKPICTTRTACQEILDLSINYPAPIWVAMEYRYMPVSQMLLKKVHEEKLLGTLHSMSIREHRFPFLKKVNDWNRFNKNTGGTLVEKCCHFFDLMRLIIKDEVTRVYAAGAQDVNALDERYDGRVPDIIDNAFVTLEFKSGKRAFLDLCMFADGSYYQEEICILGSKAKIEGRIPGPDRLWAVDNLEDLGESTGFHGEARASELIYSPRSPKQPIRELVKTDEKLQQTGDHHGGTFFQHKYFYEAISNGRAVDVSVADGVQAVMIGLAAQESIKTKRVVELSTWNFI